MANTLASKSSFVKMQIVLLENDSLIKDMRKVGRSGKNLFLPRVYHINQLTLIHSFLQYSMLQTRMNRKELRLTAALGALLADL